ncbi:C6 transcription factor [Colletotrichum incanum]|nr:C6 transcription factor [Colletotrichum incanum]
MPRKTASCWTCRLRHKKCDESLPVCKTCANLEITCHSSRKMPDWMDGGTKQQAMAKHLKAEVRRNAKFRRARRTIQRIIGDTHIIHDDIFTPSLTSATSLDIPPRPVSALIDETEYTPGAEEPRHFSNVEPPPGTSTCMRSTALYQPETTNGVSTLPTELEQTFIMLYLDYVFPALFPFYNPFPLEGGRNWVLVLALANKSFSHATTSLSSHFLAVVPIQRRMEMPTCMAVLEREVHGQVSLAMRKAQQDVNEVAQRGVHGDLITSVRLVDSIVHLLYLEACFGATETWILHLNAGISLFKEIIDYEGIDNEFGASKWTAVCQQIGRFIYPGKDNSPLWPIWTIDQAALRFSLATLIIQDLVSSTSLARVPALQIYYNDILADENDPKESPDRNCRLSLEEFTGCQNWIVKVIADIVMLDVWKEEMHKRRMLSNLELSKRGADIKKRIHEALSRVTNIKPKVRDHRPPWLAEPQQAEQEAWACILVTQIWAHAGLIYLHVVLLGWQPENTEISQSVVHNIALMSKLAKPKQLHTLAWPLCVTGCLAQREQEEEFRQIFELMRDISMFGSTRLAQEIMEAVWHRREHIDAENWGVAACLNVLGCRVLLG